MKRRHALALIGAGIVTLALGEVTIAKEATPPQPVIVAGTGIQKSQPFDLVATAYTVKATALPLETTSFPMTVWLDRVDGSVRERLVIGGVLEAGTEPTIVESAIYQVQPGRHYLDVVAPHGWSVLFTPLEV